VAITEDLSIFKDIDVIPYTKLKTFKQKDYSNRLLLTHVRGSIPPYVKPEIDLSKFSKWDLILAGDLHDHSATFEEENKKYNIVYPGSPLSCSFHRNPVKNGIILCDTETLDWEFIELKLPQLLRKTITKEEDAILTTFDHTIYEIQGNMEELTNVSTTDLIDRKIVESNKEATLNLENMSIEQELDIYLTNILNIENTEEFIGIFNDYSKKFNME
jgi:hypothetical protein